MSTPYNATNFTNGPIFNTIKGYGNNCPNFPLNAGTDAGQICMSRQNISYFNGLNKQTEDIRRVNGTSGISGISGISGTNRTKDYPQFKSEAERLMYIQGLSLTASRNKTTGRNPSAPMGVPCSTIYQIINS